MKYVEQLIYKLIVWEDLLICEGKNEKNIYIYPVRKLEGVLWNCGVGSFVGSRRVCFEIVWVERGSKENEKAQQPRKTVQKQYFSYLDIQHNRHAVLFQLRFLSPNLHNNSQLIEALYFPNLFYLVLNISLKHFEHFFEN